MIALPVLEEIIDRAGVAPRIELLLPIGVRARQLLVRTLLLGMLLVLADRRPAFLTEVHHALVSLPEADQRRLGVLAGWKTGPHLLTYRQTERDLRPGRRRPGQGHPRRAAVRDPREDLRRPAGSIHPG